ncbi:MAG TPA: glycosyltransferase family 2 protein [Methanofastidiosum sp.]|nr:glycosyltransferase family 2 protein [Methanofastidiosum sp.]
MKGVSFVTIVQNEEKYIGRLLDSVIPRFKEGLLKEIIVIDGVSRDNTVQVCLEKGVTVVSHSFNLHFGDQRNFAISLAHYEWILMLDADEVLEEKFWSILPSLVEQQEFDVYAFPRKNYIDDVFDEKSYPDYQYRLFRRFCRWIYPVHEELVGWRNAKKLDVHIIHAKDTAKLNWCNETLYPLIEKLWKVDTRGN